MTVMGLPAVEGGDPGPQIVEKREQKRAESEEMAIPDIPVPRAIPS